MNDQSKVEAQSRQMEEEKRVFSILDHAIRIFLLAASMCNVSIWLSVAIFSKTKPNEKTMVSGKSHADLMSIDDLYVHMLYLGNDFVEAGRVMKESGETKRGQDIIDTGQELLDIVADYKPNYSSTVVRNPTMQ